jgi:hypothetical protein
MPRRPIAPLFSLYNIAKEPDKVNCPLYQAGEERIQRSSTVSTTRSSGHVLQAIV